MNRQTENMLIHASENSIFYQKKWSNISREDLLKDWAKVPVTYKDEIIGSEDEMIPFFYLAQPEKYQLQTERTSGSTGKCLEITWRAGDHTRSMLSLWVLRKKYYGIKPSDRFCYFYTCRGYGDQEKEYELKKNELGFSKQDLSEQKLDEIMDRMQEFRPVWLLLQPSIAMVLARYIFEYGVEDLDFIKYIELSGEMVTESGRRFIENAFDCPVASQYGCYEANSIAYECPEGRLHIMEDNVYVDILDEKGKNIPEGEEGNIVITSKHNYAMPFVKYAVGDYGMFTGEQCTCGNCGKVLRLTKGRKNDQIRLRSGEYISIYAFIRVFQCIEQLEEILVYQYQVVQKDYDSFQVHVVMKGSQTRLEQCFRKHIFQEELREAEYQFIYHDKLLPDPVTGKLRMFMNQMKM